MPVLQRVALKRGREVAFLGVDLKDNRPAARALPRDRPADLPELRGPRRAIFNAVRARRGAVDGLLRRRRAQGVHPPGPVPVSRATSSRRHRPLRAGNAGGLRVVTVTVRCAQGEQRGRRRDRAAPRGVRRRAGRAARGGRSTAATARRCTSSRRRRRRTVVGTCRLLADGPTLKLGRMAVARAARGAAASGCGCSSLADDAGGRRGRRADRAGGAADRAAALRAGRVPHRAADVFLDAGIEHVWMEKRRA